MPTKQYKYDCKKFLKLWWEYLRRSEKYKKFCEVEPSPIYQHGTKFELYSKEFQVEKLQPDGTKHIVVPMFNVYINFRNIHSTNFNSWYANRIDPERRKRNTQGTKTISKEWYLNIPPKKRTHTPNVKEYDPEQDMGQYIGQFKKQQGREPTISEIIDRFRFIKKHIPIRYLTVDLSGSDNTEDMVREFAKYIKDYRRSFRELQSRRNLNPFLNGYKEYYLRLDEIERYLKVYDLKKKGLSINAIIKKIEPKKDITTNIQHAYYQDITRAKKLIENTELGIFPGDYQP